MKFGLDLNVIEKISKVLSSFPQVDKAVLYGSRAKGTYQNGSDIDLTLFGRSDLTLQVLNHINSQLDELMLPYTIDLSIFYHIKDEDVINHIERVGMTFYKRVGKTIPQH